MNTISVIDETFDSNVTSTYQLLMQLQSNSFSFCILDTVRMKFLALKSFSFENRLSPEEYVEQIHQIFHTEGYLIRSYKLIHIIYVSPQSILVPSPLFQSDRLEAYFRYSSPVEDDHEILYARIPIIDSHVLFTIPSIVKAELEKDLDQVKFFHQSCTLVTDALIDPRGSSQGSRVYLQINHDFFDIAVFSGSQLSLYNSFNFKTSEDLIFFVLYVYDQLGLNPEECHLWICGSVGRNDLLISHLQKYIRKTGFLEFNRSFSYSYTFNDLIQHQFSQLINLARCES